MPDVAMVVDTTHYMTTEFAQAQGWSEVSLYVTLDDRQEREADVTDLDDFYARLKASSGMPTTSQPSNGDFLAAYEPLLAAERDIVVVTIAGGISGTAESARQAAEQALEDHPERRIEVVDSRTGCAATGMIALAASNLAKTGADVEAVAQRATEAAEELRIWFAVDTLEYLRRGGRIGAAQAFLGTALKIKPILTCRDTILPVEKVRTSSRAMDRLVEFATEHKAQGRTAYGVQHIQAPAEAQRLIDRLTDLFGVPPVATGQIGPVIGSHIGPGLLGMAVMPAELLA